MRLFLNTKVTLNGSRTVTNYYGGGGATRVKKTDSQLGSRYYGSGTEHDSTGAVKKKHIYAFGKCIAYVDSASNTYWMHHDLQGSVKLITSSTGDSVVTYKYYPFGDSLFTRGAAKNDLKYTGQSYVEGVDAYDYGTCIAYIDSSGSYYWMHHDAQGSAKPITNTSGDSVATYKYYPFGDSLFTRGQRKERNAVHRQS